MSVVMWFCIPFGVMQWSQIEQQITHPTEQLEA